VLQRPTDFSGPALNSQGRHYPGCAIDPVALAALLVSVEQRLRSPETPRRVSFLAFRHQQQVGSTAFFSHQPEPIPSRCGAQFRWLGRAFYGPGTLRRGPRFPSWPSALASDRKTDKRWPAGGEFLCA